MALLSNKLTLYVGNTQSSACTLQLKKEVFKKVKCKACHYDDTKVIESRDVADGEAIRRRRMCPRCGERFTTYERLERPQLVVVKNSGVREMFSRDKLMSGLLRASEKTTLTALQLERLVTDVERELYACGESEVSS